MDYSILMRPETSTKVSELIFSLMVPSSTSICLGRILRTATTQFTARQGDISQHHPVQDRAIQRWLECVKCAVRGKLCG